MTGYGVIFQERKRTSNFIPVHTVEAYEECKGVTALTLNINTRSRWVARLIHQPFNPHERTHDWHSREGWMGPRASWVVVGNRKISCPCQKSYTGSSSPQPNHYTSFTTQVRISTYMHCTIRKDQRMCVKPGWEHDAVPYLNHNYTTLLYPHTSPWSRIHISESLAKNRPSNPCADYNGKPTRNWVGNFPH